MPVTAKQGGYRGLYMTLGALVVIAVLVAAGLYLPRWARTRAGGAAAGNSQPSSQPSAAGTPSAPAPNADASSAAQPSSAPAAGADSANPPSQPQTSNPPSTPAAGLSSSPTTSGAPPSRPPKKASHAAKGDQQAASGNASGAEPSSQPPPNSESSPPQAAGNGTSQPEAANAAEIEDVESQMDQLSARARAVKDSVENLRRQQQQQGLNLRGDISTAEDLMATYMDKAQAALQSHNAKDARRYLEKAETNVETLEKFLGHR
jgi:eukaryotic-like serine/threonine-protein kinase